MFSHHPNRHDIGRGDRYARGWEVSEGSAITLSWALQVAATSPIVFKDGYRSEQCFLSADWIGLDFDEGPTLADIQNTFCDTIHVLGTTKSHQVAKGHKPPCDRFRLWLKLTQTITKAADYKETVRYLVRTYEADEACVGAAQLFWPCTTIASVSDEGYTTDVVPAKEKPYAQTRPEYNGRIPYWVKEWLLGKFPGGEDHRRGRNFYVFKTSVWLTKNGWPEEEIVRVVMSSELPIAKTDDVLAEVRKAVRSGRLRAEREIKGARS